jgi:hypothetical protein
MKYRCKECGYGPFASTAGLESHARVCPKRKVKR